MSQIQTVIERPKGLFVGTLRSVSAGTIRVDRRCRLVAPELLSEFRESKAMFKSFGIMEIQWLDDAG